MTRHGREGAMIAAYAINVGLFSGNLRYGGVSRTNAWRIIRQALFLKS